MSDVRGVYFQKSNPPVFAGLSLPQTDIRPKHKKGVVWAAHKIQSIFELSTLENPLFSLIYLIYSHKNVLNI